MATPGYVTCHGCLAKLRADLKEVVRRYLKLNPRPGGTATSGTPRPPGFHSTPAGSLHIMAMRDIRSSHHARVWLAGDGRVHKETETPPLSVPGELRRIARSIALTRGHTEPAARTVPDLAAWLDPQLDWVTRHDLATRKLVALVRTLVVQLREDHPAAIAPCPEGCGATLRATYRSGYVRCRCGASWGPDQLAWLGRRISAA
jgi:hypothetical protein